MEKKIPSEDKHKDRLLQRDNGEGDMLVIAG